MTDYVRLIVVVSVFLSSAALADVSISNKPTQNMSCSGGVCTATAQKAVLNVGELQTMLSSGDVTVKTGSVTDNIEINQPVTWSSTSRLSLVAQQSVTVKKPVTVMGTGNLTITTNHGGHDGEFIIVPEHGSVQLWDKNSSLVIDGQSYTLVYDIKTLAADIAANPSGFYALAKPYVSHGTYARAPIGILFQGIFNGLGNGITSLSITSSVTGDLVALFAAIGTEGAVLNFGVLKTTLSGRDANGFGVLAGNNFGTITRCWATGHISFPVTVSAGGLVAANEGRIANSYADVRISGSGAGVRIGGLTGFNDTTAIISGSFALHSIAVRNAGEADVGGLTGENKGTIENSFSRSGLTEGKNLSGVNVGGLVGKNDLGGTVSSNYAAGMIVSKGGQLVGGGLIGFDGAKAGSIAASYWDLDMGISDPSQGAGNVPNDPGITGLTTAQFRSGLPEGFDPNIWGQAPNFNNGYPYLLANPPAK